MEDKEFFVLFYDSGKADFYPDDTTDTETIEFEKGQMLRVTEPEMFRWLEKAHHEKIKLSIYQATCVCDLS